MRHAPEWTVRKLRETDRLLAENTALAEVMHRLQPTALFPARSYGGIWTVRSMYRSGNDVGSHLPN